MADSDYLYALLNVSRSASDEELRNAYRRLLIFHPDRAARSSSRAVVQTAQQTFVNIQQAHDVLTDPVLRLAYDVGGDLAVTLVQRSKSAASSSSSKQQQTDRKQQEQDGGTETTEDNDSEDSEEDNDKQDLYTAIKRARSHAEASDIIQEAVISHQNLIHQNDRPMLNVSVELGHDVEFGGKKNSLQRETSSISAQNRQAISKRCTLTLGAESIIQQTNPANTNVMAALHFQQNRRTKWTMSTMASTVTGRPRVFLRTTRNFANGSNWLLGMGTLGPKIQSFDISSTRNITVPLYYSLAGLGIQDRETTAEQEDENKPTSSESARQKGTTKVQASWKMNANVRSGAIQALELGFKTIKFPRLQFHFVPMSMTGELPVTVSYKHASDNANENTTVSLSFGDHWSVEILRGQRGVFDGDWVFKYGVRYDNPTSSSDLSMLTILLEMQSPQWSWSLPLNVKPESFVTFSCYGFIQWQISAMLEGVTGRRSPPPVVTLQQKLSYAKKLPFSHFLDRVASKKRRMESESSGLIILHANLGRSSFHRNQSQVDVSNVLQYWVRNGMLRIPFEWTQSWIALESIDSHNRWWDTIWRLLNVPFSEPPRTQESNTDSLLTLNIRYQFRNMVYEIELDQSNVEIELPNAAAMCLGSTRTVR